MTRDGKTIKRPALVALLWALAMLFGYFGVGPVVVAQQQTAQAQQAQPTGASEGVITATTFFTQSIEVVTAPEAPAPIDQELLGKGGFFDPALEIDNGANLFLGYVRNDGLTAQGRVLRKAPSGEITGRWEVNIGSIQGWQHKADGLAAVISGDDLLVTLTSHATNPTGARIMALWGAQLDNVAVPYPGGVRPTGTVGGNISGSQATGCDNCPTLDQISGLLDVKLAAQMQTIRNEFGGNIRQGIQDKSRDGAALALTNFGLSSGSMQTRGVDQWARDRFYEVLRDQRLLPTPTATPGR
jgi:hypothetical protein